MRLYTPLCQSVCLSVQPSHFTFFGFVRSLASLLLPEWSSDLKYSPCPPARDWGIRVSGPVYICSCLHIVSMCLLVFFCLSLSLLVVLFCLPFLLSNCPPFSYTLGRWYQTESDYNLLNGESPYHPPNPSKTHLNCIILTVQVSFVFTDLRARVLN